MCDLFHALDILASTSSIWNLCVISLDRYMAGQDPIGYRDKVSTRRITIAIIFVWVISACKLFLKFNGMPIQNILRLIISGNNMVATWFSSSIHKSSLFTFLRQI